MNSSACWVIDVGQTQEERETRRLLKEHGRFVRQVRHGDLWAIGDQRVVVYREGDGSREPRAWKNTLADTRRAVRAFKSAEEPTPTQEEEGPMPDIESLGVHLDVSEKLIVQRTSKAVVPVSALLTLLGIEHNEGANVAVSDVNGRPVALDAADCLTFEVSLEETQ